MFKQKTSNKMSCKSKAHTYGNKLHGFQDECQYLLSCILKLLADCKM